MLFAATLNLNLESQLNSMTDEQYAALREKIKGFGFPPTRAEAIEKRYSLMGETRIITAEEIEALTEAGIRPEVSRAKGQVYHTREGGMVESVSVMDGLKRLAEIAASFHQTNVSLFDVRHVTWAENFCTEELQKWLNEGWRIIAVCPPNNSRRPTYILGWIGENPRSPGGYAFEGGRQA